MKILELMKIIPGSSGGSIVCQYKDMNGFQTHRFQLDKQTFDNLEALVARFPNCRFRISQTCEEVAGQSFKRGRVSVIHVQWIQYVSFYASPSFFAEIEALFSARNIKKRFQETPGSGKRSRYIPGLDGLRALAILAVIACHLHLKMVSGGFLGVTVFFVLSGYLITDLLSNEWLRTGRIDLKSYWIRRAKRLLPAVFTVIGTVLLWTEVSHPDKLMQVWGLAKSALLYVSNWWLIFHNVSYFEQFGMLNPLGHLWSLGVEEQFYLLWPFLVMGGLIWGCKRHYLGLLILAGALMSALLMYMLYQPGTDPSRVYYGTDTRAFSLLIGAAHAFAFPSRAVFRKLSAKAGNLLDIVGALGLSGILLMMWRCGEYQAFLYHGGMLLLSLLSAAVIAAVVMPGTLLGRILGLAPLRWLGKRSYGVYLWHYPIIVLTNPIVNTRGFQWSHAVLQVVACLVIAALSWKILEEPILRGKFSFYFSKILRPNGGYRYRAAAFSMILVLLTVLGVTVATADDEKAQLAFSQRETSSFGPFYPQKAQVSAPSSGKNHSGSLKEPKKMPAKPQTAKSDQSVKPAEGLTVIGDSVILDAVPYLKKRSPGIVVNGKIGRQMRQAPKVLKQLRIRNQVKQTVVIELGTNGPFSEKNLFTLLQSFNENQSIFLINTRVPRPWQGTVNNMLLKAANRFENVAMIDWYAKSKGKSGYFAKDGVHLTQTGAKNYAKMIVNAVAQNH